MWLPIGIGFVFLIHSRLADVTRSLSLPYGRTGIPELKKQIPNFARRRSSPADLTPSLKTYDIVMAVAKNRQTKRAHITYNHLSEAAENPWMEFPFFKKGLHSIYPQPALDSALKLRRIQPTSGQLSSGVQQP